VVKVVAERSYGQDEEVVISYGLKSSSECLEDHGMVPDIDMEVCICICLYMCVYVCVYICVYMYWYIYIHIYIWVRK
jgi:hypothetical protein